MLSLDVLKQGLIFISSHPSFLFTNHFDHFFCMNIQIMYFYIIFLTLAHLDQRFMHDIAVTLCPLSVILALFFLFWKFLDQLERILAHSKINLNV